MLKPLIFNVFLLCSVCIIKAQEIVDSTEKKSFELYEWGFSLGYGFVNEQLPNGKYEPFLFLAHIEFHAHRKNRKPTSPHYLLLFGEPQINPVLVNGSLSDWEGGVNIGLKYLIKIKDKNAMFFHAGSGPHFISVISPEHQANGFAFSNNFGIGFQRQFKKDIQINFGYRFRHISNLDLQLPNLGLDNHFFTVGFRKDFPRRAQARRQLKKQRLLEK